jgi:cell division protein FtsI (penicillin-binding protein 3)
MAINARKAILMRTLIVFGLMCVFASAIIFYLYKLQFVEVNKWEKEAKKYSVKNETVQAIRGNIFDCNGALLSTSLPIYDLIIDATAPSFSVKDTFDKYVDSLAIYFSNEFPEKTPNDYKLIFTNIRKKGEGYNLLKINV